jgi:phosphoribosylformylglycinamidine synthase
MHAAVVVFPGSNCDRDVAVALETATGLPPRMIWHRQTSLPNVDLIVLPGGFSYGDYLRSGAMAAHAPIMKDVIAHARRGTPVLGICNGFQILTEAGLLPGALMRNASLRFICRDVFLRAENPRAPFTLLCSHEHIFRLPIAHHDGSYYADEDTLGRLEDEGRVAFRYTDARGEASQAANPNGSAHNIAGITNEQGTILGLMPHPERLADPALGGIDGRLVFQSLIASLGR